MFARALPFIALFALLGTAALVPAQENAQSPRPYLGIQTEPRPTDAAQPGVFVRVVAPGSPADKAGIKAGDEIVQVDNKPVKDFDELVNMLAQHKAGDKLAFQLLRDGKQQNLAVTLGERRATARGSAPTPQATAFLGIGTRPLTPVDRNRLGTTADAGVVVMDVGDGTPAAKAGLQRDDVITAVDGNSVANPMELRDAIHEAGPGKKVAITVMRGKETKQLHAQLEEAPADVFRAPATGDDGAFRRLERRLERIEKRLEQLEKK